MTFTPRSRTRHRVARALSAVLCLTGLALSACSGSSNSADPGPSEEGTPRATAEAPTIDPVGTPTPGADGNGTRHTAEAPTIVLSPYSDLDEEIFGLGQGGGADAGAPGRRRPGRRGRTLREHLGL